MTNLIASIVLTLVTNVSTVDNAEYEKIQNPCPDRMPGCCVLHGFSNGAKIRDATHKTETTTVSEIRTAVVEGKSVELSRRTISQSSKHFALKTEWVAADNWQPQRPELYYITNGFGLVGGSISNTIFAATNIIILNQ